MLKIKQNYLRLKIKKLLISKDLQTLYDCLDCSNLNYLTSNHELDWILSLNPSINTKPKAWQISTSGIELLFWSPPFTNTNWCDSSKSACNISIVLHTVRSWSINRKAWSTYLICWTINKLSSSFLDSFEPFNARWWAEFTITKSKSPLDFAWIKYSKCSLWLELKYTETKIAFAFTSLLN